MAPLSYPPSHLGQSQMLWIANTVPLRVIAGNRRCVLER